MKPEMNCLRQISKEWPAIKFTENPTIATELFVPCGRTDMTQLIVAFRNFMKTPKKNVKLPAHTTKAYREQRYGSTNS